ncbi:MAG: PAS domain-containing sensor histidine kinase [Verrucomicrobiia bacterium]|jgi:PAS domain S-box-containing protein
MTHRSPPSLSTRLLLIALAAILPVQVLSSCGKADILTASLATVLALIIAWFGYKQFILRPLNALVKAARQAASAATHMRVEPALKIAEFAQLAAAINGMAAAVRDRSGKRRASEQRYKQLVDSLPEALLVQQTDRIVLANPTAMNLLGAASVTQLTDKSIMEMVHPDHHEAFTQHIAQLSKGDLLPPLEGKFLRLDGTAVDVEVTAAVLGYQDKPAVQFIARDITFRKQAEQQMRELSLRLLKAQDEERRRIARDLHDSTAQELAAMMTGLGIIEDAIVGTDGPIRQHFAECRQLAEHCATQIRTTSYLLHPPLLDEMGLAAALKHHAEGFSKRSDIEVTLDLPTSMGRFPLEIELALFRVVQESLSNTQRHSGSSTATIRLLHDAENTVLEVQDRGRGLPFAVGDSTQLPIDRLGVGIVGMQERLRHLGGRLSVISNDQGTTVRAILPRSGI